MLRSDFACAILKLPRGIDKDRPESAGSDEGEKILSAELDLFRRAAHVVHLVRLSNVYSAASRA